MPNITDPTDPEIDCWSAARSRVDLGLRYSMRGRLPAAKTSARFAVRIDELFGRLRPGEAMCAPWFDSWRNGAREGDRS